MAGSSRCSPPESDEVEVSLFGPGYGESVAVHLGRGEWLIVDSCVEGQSKTPAVLKYLEDLGVDPSQQVKVVLATHWHDDHVRGLAQVVELCQAAEFWCSAGLVSDEFLTLVMASNARAIGKISSGADEFGRILEILERRIGRRGSTGPRLASDGKTLWKKNGQGFVTALSPSDGSVVLAQRQIAKLLPEGGSPKKRISAQGRNDLSVVLWISVGRASILLGSDLEVTGDDRTGWEAVLSSASRPDRKASYIKVPHHGSKDSDHPGIWNELLRKSPVAALTPWTRAGNVLPDGEDIERLSARTEMAFSTSRTRIGRTKFRDPVVARTLRETVRSIKRPQPPTGQVRVRCDAEQEETEWAVELFGAAIPLTDMVL